jgi:hypothetical protein
VSASNCFRTRQRCESGGGRCRAASSSLPATWDEQHLHADVQPAQISATTGLPDTTHLPMTGRWPASASRQRAAV